MGPDHGGEASALARLLGKEGPLSEPPSDGEATSLPGHTVPFPGNAASAGPSGSLQLPLPSTSRRSSS